MKSSRRARFFPTTTTYTYRNDHSIPPSNHKTIEIPILSPPSSPSPPLTSTDTFPNDHYAPPSHPKTTEIPVLSPPSSPSPPPTPTTNTAAAATKIQATYRAHLTRTLYLRIAAVNSDADKLQRLIQRQETVDAVRSDGRERIRINEALMALLLKLDSVPGFDPEIRELRRRVSRRIVGLQEIMDAVSDERVEDWVGLMEKWDDVVERMEEEVCKEKVGVYDYEMARFCAERLGFRCFQRFLLDQ